MPHDAYKRLVLSALPGTASDAMELTGLPRVTVGRWLARCHTAGEIHISGWVMARNGGGPFTARYALGPGKDAPCKLKRQSGAQTAARYYASLKASGRLVPSRHAPQPWFAALIARK